MFNKLIERLLAQEGELPNKFTRAMGKLIREARTDAHLSQAELAKIIFKRQAAISDMENGKMEPSATTLLLMSYALYKPLGYFFPRNQGVVELYGNDLRPEEQELIFNVRRLDEEELPKLIAQTKALADLAEKQLEKQIAEDIKREQQEKHK